MELTIAMLIAAIVVGMAYTAFSILTRSQQLFIRKSERLDSLLQLDKVLKRDFYKSRMIFAHERGVTFKMDSDSVSYNFGQDFIIRSQAQADTFKFEFVDEGIYFEGRSLPVDDPSTSMIIDELEFSVFVDKEKIPYQYHKAYSSSDMFNLDRHAFN
jgi:hypothetical protein